MVLKKHQYSKTWLQKRLREMPECCVCHEEFDENEGFYCNDCGEFCCNAHGDGDLCGYCLGDEVFLFDVLGFEEES